MLICRCADVQINMQNYELLVFYSASLFIFFRLVEIIFPNIFLI